MSSICQTNQNILALMSLRSGTCTGTGSGGIGGGTGGGGQGQPWSGGEGQPGGPPQGPPPPLSVPFVPMPDMVMGQGMGQGMGMGVGMVVGQGTGQTQAQAQAQALGRTSRVVVFEVATKLGFTNNVQNNDITRVTPGGQAERLGVTTRDRATHVNGVMIIDDGEWWMDVVGGVVGGVMSEWWGGWCSGWWVEIRWEAGL